MTALATAFAFCVAAALAETHEAEGPRLLASQAAGSVPVDDERYVVVDGVTGDLTVRVGKPGELRFRSFKADGRTPSPLAVWLDGPTLRLAAPDGSPAEARLLDVAIGGDLAVTVRSAGSAVRLNGLLGAVSVFGEHLNIDARGLKRSLTLEVARSSAVVESLEADVRIRGKELAAVLSAITGDLDAELEGGKLEVKSVRSLSLVAVRTPIVVAGVQGPVNLRASGETLVLSQARKGGELTLTGTPAKLDGLEGEVSVSTDSELTFQDCRASLHIDSYGGAVRGAKNEGLLEVRTRNAEVAVSGIFGPTRIQGEALRLLVGDVTGDLYVDASGSQMTIPRPGGAVEILGERNNVSIVGSMGPVKVTSRQGAVRITQARGPVDVQAEDDDVVVSWASINTQAESSIVNGSGGIRLRMPPGTPCRLEAKSERGRVTSEINRVVVAQDGSSAEGPLAVGGHPLIRVAARGDVAIVSSEIAEPPPDEGSGEEKPSD